LSIRERIALLIAPSLCAELDALRSGNTKVVLENAMLLDEIEALKHDIERYITIATLELASP
jgi:hypothetical protein